MVKLSSRVNGQAKDKARVRVGGARTYRGLVGTAEISGGLQASQNELGMHTILGTRPPSEPYSLGALTPPTLVNICPRSPSVKLTDDSFEEFNLRASRSDGPVTTEDHVMLCGLRARSIA
jgi:hypothetical protein